jgi:hypothetical protein
MARTRRQSDLFRGNDIEELRRILIYARDRLSINRSTITGKVDASGFDFDNFTLSDPRSTSKPPKYKSTVPRPEFQRRMLYFVLTDPLIRDAANARNSPIRNSYLAMEKYRSEATEPKGADELFNHLVKIGVIRDRNDCEKLLERLEGCYYAYRTLQSGNRISKAHVTVSKFDIYHKVPRFIHRKTDESNSKVIVSKGTIIDLNNRYIFHGLVLGTETSEPSRPSGIKLMILNHGNQESYFDGVFLSCNELGRYEFGKIKLVRTSDKYSRDKIDIIERGDLTFRYEELFLHPVNWRETLPQFANAIVSKFSRDDTQVAKKPSQ